MADFGLMQETMQSLTGGSRFQSSAVVLCVFHHQSRHPKEMTIRTGDRLLVLNSDRNWWRVRNERGRTGYVPSTHLCTLAGVPVTQLKWSHRSPQHADPPVAAGMHSHTLPSMRRTPTVEWQVPNGTPPSGRRSNPPSRNHSPITVARASSLPIDGSHSPMRSSSSFGHPSVVSPTGEVPRALSVPAPPAPPPGTGPGSGPLVSPAPPPPPPPPPPPGAIPQANGGTSLQEQLKMAKLRKTEGGGGIGGSLMDQLKAAKLKAVGSLGRGKHKEDTLINDVMSQARKRQSTGGRLSIASPPSEVQKWLRNHSFPTGPFEDMPGDAFLEQSLGVMRSKVGDADVAQQIFDASKPFRRRSSYLDSRRQDDESDDDGNELFARFSRHSNHMGSMKKINEESSKAEDTAPPTPPRPIGIGAAAHQARVQGLAGGQHYNALWNAD